MVNIVSKLGGIALAILWMTSCSGERELCEGCSNAYPFYKSSHLVSTAKNINELHVDIADRDVELKSLNKVFVLPFSKRKTVVVFLDDLATALEQDGWKVLDSDTQIVSNNPKHDIYQATGFKHVDILLFYMTDMSESEPSKYFYTKWKNLGDVAKVKIAINEDLNYQWQLETGAYFCRQADAVLIRYPEAFDQLFKTCSASKYHFPHWATDAFLAQHVPFANKEKKVLLSGATRREWYPIRAKALELMGPKSPIYQRVHPGYVKQMNPKEEAEKYAASIASHDLAIAGAGMGKHLAAPYVLAKHFEIAAAGTVMITDKLMVPLLANLGFIENEHYLTTTVETLEADLERFLNPDFAAQLEKISTAGREVVAREHTLEKRIQQLKTVITWHWQQK